MARCTLCSKSEIWITARTFFPTVPWADSWELEAAGSKEKSTGREAAELNVLESDDSHLVSSLSSSWELLTAAKTQSGQRCIPKCIQTQKTQERGNKSTKNIANIIANTVRTGMTSN